MDAVDDVTVYEYDIAVGNLKIVLKNRFRSGEAWRYTDE